MGDSKEKLTVMNSSARLQFDWLLSRLIVSCREATETIDNERLPVLTSALLTCCKAYREYETAYYVGW